MGLIIIMIRYLVLIVAFIDAATAVTHQVGDSTEGWAVPSSTSFYTTWANSQKFSVGDILEFKWTSTHNVLEVTKTEYDDCTGTNGVPSSTSPVSVNLTNTTARYFICTVGSHCTSGQKLAVTSVAATNSTSGSSASMPTAALLPALLSTIAIISFLITI
ncbi:umecyanin-like [Juglans microcarpa x Juglans regia]|uniref:umecyanin-like n=1 Tax=Juglans microcarpa x Juglans regia TaxID=2249226 RepID=UPI001B7F2CC4|nr:umecyanin-like [Juglans microcarpa x Juglans regia]